MWTTDLWGFPSGLDGKEPACDVGNLGSVPGSGRSLGEGNGNPLQYSCLEKSHGQRSLVGYSPRGHKESEKTKQLTRTYIRPQLSKQYYLFF